MNHLKNRLTTAMTYGVGGLNPHDIGDPVVLLNTTSGSKIFTEPVLFCQPIYSSCNDPLTFHLMPP